MNMGIVWGLWGEEKQTTNQQKKKEKRLIAWIRKDSPNRHSMSRDGEKCQCAVVPGRNKIPVGSSRKRRVPGIGEFRGEEEDGRAITELRAEVRKAKQSLQPKVGRSGISSTAEAALYSISNTKCGTSSVFLEHQLLFHKRDFWLHPLHQESYQV